jgi:hypothetical protein
MLLVLWIHFFVKATPVTYFAVATAVLAPLACVGTEGVDHHIDGALLVFLSAVLLGLPSMVLRSCVYEVASDMVATTRAQVPSDRARLRSGCLAASAFGARL